MDAYRPDRVVRVLSTVVSIAYYGLWVVAVAVLVALPAAKLLAANDPGRWVWPLEVPAPHLDSEARVNTSWGPASLVVEDVRGDLRLPIPALPWWLVAMMWTQVAVMLALMLLSLHHLRRIFQRVRDGAPFDADNALRMRWLGLLLLAEAVFSGVADLATSLAVGSGLRRDGVTVATGLHIDVALVFVALVVVALAEIFRRGAELEREQSLVI